MIDRVMLTNWRRFPRARVNCDVVYGDRFQSWRSHTRDISLGGCRVVGYYPFPLGKTLSLRLTRSGVGELSIAGKVVRLYGGADNAVGVVFQGDERSRAQLEQWLQKVLAAEPDVLRTISRMPGQLPLEAHLRRASSRQPGRPLSRGEQAVLECLDKSPGGVSLQRLRADWGDEWERRAQVIFDLIAEGLVTYVVPVRRPSNARPDPSGQTSSINTQKLMEQLESEYGPLGHRFAQQVETITHEVSRWNGGEGAGSPGDAPSHSGHKTPIAFTWVSVPAKKR